MLSEGGAEAVPSMSAVSRSRTPKILQSSRAQAVLIGAVVLIAAAIAIPQFVTWDNPNFDENAVDLAEVEALARVERKVQEAAPAAAAAEEQARQDEERLQRLRAGAMPSADGDLDVGLRLRWTEFPAGAPIRARVSVRNMSLEPIHVPAPGEAQPTLLLEILDAEGATVRRVVEQTPDVLPHRTLRLEAGERAEMKVDVIVAGEDPLPPGEYRLVAEYTADPAWRRTGLPMWAAPAGPRRSDYVTFHVTAPSEPR